MSAVEDVLRGLDITPTTGACAAFRAGQASVVAQVGLDAAEEQLSAAEARIDVLEDELAVLHGRLREIWLLAGRRV